MTCWASSTEHGDSHRGETEGSGAAAERRRAQGTQGTVEGLIQWQTPVDPQHIARRDENQNVKRELQGWRGGAPGHTRYRTQGWGGEAAQSSKGIGSRHGEGRQAQGSQGTVEG